MARHNPYREVHRRLRENQPRGLGWLLPLLAAGLATPLARPRLLGFLDGGDLFFGVEAVSFRLGALVAAAMALHTYSDLVRGPDRAVLDAHPVQPRPLLVAIALRTARQRLYLPAVAAIILLPIGLEASWLAWAGASAVVLSCWLGSLGVGFAVSLGGVWAARSPRAALLLDMLRGENPRMQAALIYAPGVALAAMGVAAGLAAAGVAAALDGWAPGWAWLLIPTGLGAVGWAIALPLAQQTYVPASLVLAEIDALWASIEEPETDLHVYLEWVARDGGEVLRALRQGWRSLRTWPMGAWGLGLVGAIMGMSGDRGAEDRVLLVCGAATVFIAAVAARMDGGDPEWLDRALGVDRLRVARARWLVAALYAQGVVLPSGLAVALKHGAWGPLLGLELLGLTGSGLAALLAFKWRARGLWGYGPIGLLLWAAVTGSSLV